MEQVAHRHCGISIPEDGKKKKKKHFGHGPGHPALGGPS